MKVIAINGSPRKKWNTATLLEKALEGAASEGAETEIIHLYDLNFKGCISCFACKLKDGKSYGKCAVEDDLTPVLEKLENTDAVILGSPIYLGNSTGEMRSFMERYVFPYLVYSNNIPSLYPKNTPVGFIYTMGIKEEYFDMFGLRKTIELSLCQNHLKCFKSQIKALNSIFSRKISLNSLKMQPSKSSWCSYQIFSSNFKSR
jgi:multimeric flavodoxin WrbA